MKAIVASGACSVVGGGESLMAIEHAGVFDQITLVSSGGGAMLTFLAGDPMPGLAVLE